MFNLNNFVMRTLTAMRYTEGEDRVRRYALGWYDKGILSDADMEKIDGFYADMPEVEGSNVITDTEYENDRIGA